MSRLSRERTALVVIDVQERLMPAISGREEVERNIVRLIRGCAVLRIPALATEQYVKGLGPTVGGVRRAFEETSGFTPFEKLSFSAARCTAFAEQLAASGRTQVLLCGVEAHVCVYQTALDLQSRFEIHLATDAVSSRSAANKELAVRRLEREGILLTSTEMALFELCGQAGNDEFRAISRLIK
jgi:nicotinamidase-related amidase